MTQARQPTHSDKPMLRVLAGHPCTPPPIWLMRQAGRYLPEYREMRTRAADFLEFCYSPELAVEATCQPIARYGMDGAILFSDILVVPDALGREVRFVEGEGPRLEPLRTVGAIDALDVGAIRTRLAPVYETVRRLKDTLPDAVTLIGFAGAPWTVATYMVEGRGGSDFAAIKDWAASKPDEFSRLMDVLVEATADHLAAQVEAGADAVQVFDSWAGVLHGDAFDRWCIEPTVALLERFRNACPGTPVIGFPRGAAERYVDYALHTGVEAVSLDQGIAVDWAAEHLLGICAVQGNLDNALLRDGGEAMEKAVQDILEGFAGAPHIFNLGHGVFPETPPENVARLVEQVRAGPA